MSWHLFGPIGKHENVGGLRDVSGAKRAVEITGRYVDIPGSQLAGKRGSILAWGTLNEDNHPMVLPALTTFRFLAGI